MEKSGARVSSAAGTPLMTACTMTSRPSAVTPAASHPRTMGSRSGSIPTPRSVQRSWWLREAAVTRTSSQPSGGAGTGASVTERQSRGCSSLGQTAMTAGMVGFTAGFGTGEWRHSTGRPSFFAQTPLRAPASAGRRRGGLRGPQVLEVLNHLPGVVAGLCEAVVGGLDVLAGLLQRRTVALVVPGLERQHETGDRRCRREPSRSRRLHGVQALLGLPDVLAGGHRQA